jgi:hypothetical protein
MDYIAQIHATINAIIDDNNHGLHGNQDRALSALDSWIDTFQQDDSGSLNPMVTELQRVREYIRNGDTLELSQSLQRLGQETSRSALSLHNDLGDQLRHLGQVLISAAGNIKASA